MDEAAVARVIADLDASYAANLAANLAAIPSIKREAEIADYLYREVRSLGWDAEVQEIGPGRANLIARLPGASPGRTLLFNGHLDTSDLPPGWTEDPWKTFIRDGWIYGAEINNMKASLAAMVAAMRHLQRTGVRFKGEIVLSAVGSEIDSLGWGTVYALRHGLRADACICGEPTDFTVATFHSGPVQFDLRVRGTMYHSADEEKAINANVGLAHLVTRIHKGVLSAERGKYADLPRLMIGVMRGGKLPQFSADEAVATIDVRLAPGMSPEQVKMDLERVVEQTRQEHPWIDAEVIPRQPPEFCPAPAFEVDPNSEIVQVMRAGVRLARGIDPPVGRYRPMIYFSTDARHILAAGIESVVCGPGEHVNQSTPQERIKVQDVADGARAFAAAALLYLRA